MNTFKVILLPENRTLFAATGASLADALSESPIPIGFPCRGRGLCGKCLVEIVSGDAGVPDAAERTVLDRRARGKTHRLACRVVVRGPLTIRIAPEARLSSIAPLIEGRRREIALDPPMKKFALAVPADSRSDPESALDGLLGRFLEPRPSASPALLSVLGGLESDPRETVTAVLYEDRRILAVEPGDTAGRDFGAAVDLGTTTVVAEIIDLNDGRTLAAAAGLNGQARFGADVVSRITAAHLEPALLAGLRDEARRTINGLLDRARGEAGIEASEIYETVIAGNTAMNHLFLGLPVDGLAVAPFRALFSALEPIEAAAGGLAVNPAGRIYLAPNIRSFVGGDIAAGLTAADFENGPEKALFLDLGTNGEIVVKNGARLSTTSTAAGPAFEGMGISCGMIAAPGAVYKAEKIGSGISVQVIGAGEAQGVCGSGLIDVLAAALELGWMDAGGLIPGPKKSFRLAEGLELTQKDIREVQLASAAIRTGMRMLLDEVGLSVAELDRIFVAGAFGSTLDIGSAMRIGLLPCVDREKVEFIGNASLSGARLLLLSGQERKRCETLAQKITHLPLAQSKTFQDIFIESLQFKNWK